MCGTPEYRAWSAMKVRCDNPNHPYFADYGGRGITYTPSWTNFTAFFADMGLRPSDEHTLERVDNNQGYSRDNCVWALQRDQNQNRRNVRWVAGQCLTDAIREAGLPYDTVDKRLRSGWPVERALKTPLRSYTRRAA